MPNEFLVNSNASRSEDYAISDADKTRTDFRGSASDNDKSVCWGFDPSSCHLIEQVLLYNKENQEPVLVLDFFRTVLDRFKSSRKNFDQTFHALNLLLFFFFCFFFLATRNSSSSRS